MMVAIEGRDKKFSLLEDVHSHLIVSTTYKKITDIFFHLFRKN